VRKGRQIGNKKLALLGQKNRNAKLNDENVKEIRKLRKSGMTHKNISKIFGVSSVSITQILLGRTWSHVRDDI